MKKKMWKEWAVEHIQKVGTCPGDTPSFGLPEDVVSLEEFELSIKSKGVHKYQDCHFVAEVLGASSDLKEVNTANKPIASSIDPNILQNDMSEVVFSKRLAKLKEHLHIYVDRIYFKKNGALSVPEPLLNISEYIKNSL